ncbi:MAG: YicC/YloC family endoribonuclease [Clostridium sp.]|uniref:YicC/YloC family endoribonuclease n=1 Tax=Clostridium sp. TaxID=1506 RepID=UPI00304B1820
MIKSMTGYGRGTNELEGLSFNVELKSVNNRYLDINIRLPRAINSLEDRIRKEISSKVSRGKVDVFITFENKSESNVNINVDENMANAYFSAYSHLKSLLNIEENISLSLISRAPDVINVEKEEEDLDKIWGVLKTALNEALTMFLSMREAEGSKLCDDVLSRCDFILDMIEKVEERSPSVVAEYREKITQRLNDFLGEVEIDQVRLLNEVAFFSDKCSIAEETVRLRSHIVQLKSSLEVVDESVGRKLDFLIQEMNRETNTIGSKANDLTITRVVVDIKSEIEKIREQIQNIE